MPIREIKLKSYKEQIFELFSEGAQPPRSSIQGWLEPPSPHVVGAYGCALPLCFFCFFIIDSTNGSLPQMFLSLSTAS